MNYDLFISKRLFYFALLIVLVFTTNCSEKNKSDLTAEFSGKYGQIEIGGKYAGLEFHHSRPLPSRLSFYYPVANSVDLSQGYWIRDKSMPFKIIINTNQATDTLGLTPIPYKYTPYHIDFKEVKNKIEVRYEYDVCEDLPVIVMKIIIKNMNFSKKKYKISTTINTTIRTCHTYSIKSAAKIQYNENNSYAVALYPYTETDSTCLFVVNVGTNPIAEKIENTGKRNNSSIGFNYVGSLNGRQKKEIIYLIGTCKIGEYESIIHKAKAQWSQSIQKNYNRINDYAFKHSYFQVGDEELQKTMHWSKALIATNIHYINGEFVPMPCPAEYNFFFTHDLLLTSLGVVYFDMEYARKGLMYIKSLTNKDNVLPHAYYWKDNQYVTEFCNSSNWNHLWFIILAASYLKHSDDLETIEDIFPMLKNSMGLMLTNKNTDQLMYAKYPDWWDIGNVYGARSYITILMHKALRDYIYLSSRLEKDIHLLTGYLDLAEKMKKSLIEKLWDEEKGYLFNMIDDKTYDWHYYAGSIVATHYNLLEPGQSKRLLSTVKERLLDKNIGVRNVMPADFHQLTDMYNFKGMEAGLQYIYINGGVWPHNNAWYILGLIVNGQTDEAKCILKKYLTLDGIKNSPNGMPAFYEYRIADSASPRYGEIDKPSFLWAAGFYLSALYQLTGVRENSNNLYFDPRLPQEMNDVEYDLTLFGKLCRVMWSGNGDFFNKIVIDGKESVSAVQFKPADNIWLERGKPLYPYLANCNAQVLYAAYDELTRVFKLGINGYTGQRISMKIVSPLKIMEIEEKDKSDHFDIQKTEIDEIMIFQILIILENKTGEISIKFK